MGWGKWDYLNSFRAEMSCLSSSFRNVLLLSTTFTCSRAALLHMRLQGKWGVLLWLKNDTILQQCHHPWFEPRFEELLLPPPQSTLLVSCAACTCQCCHLRLRIFTVLLYLTSTVSSTPHSFTSQHLNRQKHHSSSGSSLKSPIHWLAPPADLQA